MRLEYLEDFISFMEALRCREYSKQIASFAELHG